MTKMMIASTQSVEVINLDESNPELICDPLPDLPYLDGPTGIYFTNYFYKSAILKHPKWLG
jgi:hypothetical protein